MHPIPEMNMRMNNNSMIEQTLFQKFEAIAIRRLVRKLDWRLLPYLFLIEIVSYINRISTGRSFRFTSFTIDDLHLGHAMLMDIETDLHLVGNEIAWSVSLFFLAYVRKEHDRMMIFFNQSFILADFCYP